MRVLQVIPSLAPQKGGSVYVVSHLSRELARRGNDVTIITTDLDLDSLSADNLRSSGVKIKPFRCVADFRSFLWSPDMKRWLSTAISEFDIVHLHDFRTYQSSVASRIARAKKTPYVLQPHGSVPRIIRMKTEKVLFDLVWGKPLLRNACKLIAVSREELGQFSERGIGRDRSRLVYNGMDMDLASSLPEYGQARAWLSIPQNHKVLLFLGRVSKTKGLEFLLESFALIKERNDLWLVIAGPDNNHMRVLVALASRFGVARRVIFTGQVRESEKAALYRDADVFLHTVQYMAGVGVAPLEAALCGCPVIVTDECGEIIKEANCGYIVRYGDVEQLADIIRQVLDCPDKARTMALNAREYVKKNLTWEKATVEMECIYEECIIKREKSRSPSQI